MTRSERVFSENIAYNGPDALLGLVLAGASDVCGADPLPHSLLTFSIDQVDSNHANGVDDRG